MGGMVRHIGEMYFCSPGAVSEEGREERSAVEGGYAVLSRMESMDGGEGEKE
jgi:hypothetical protein